MRAARSRLLAWLSTRGAGSSSSRSKVAPTTQSSSSAGSTMPPRSTTARGASTALAGTYVTWPRTRRSLRCGSGCNRAASAPFAKTTTLAPICERSLTSELNLRSRRSRHPGMRRCLVARHELRVVGRHGERRQRATLGESLLFVARELKDAARVPARSEPRPALKRGEERGSGDAREEAVVGGDQRMKRAGVISRRLPRGPGVALEQGDTPAAGAQPLADGRSGEACADDRRCLSLGKRRNAP